MISLLVYTVQVQLVSYFPLHYRRMSVHLSTVRYALLNSFSSQSLSFAMPVFVQVQETTSYNRLHVVYWHLCHNTGERGTDMDHHY